MSSADAQRAAREERERAEEERRLRLIQSAMEEERNAMERELVELQRQQDRIKKEHEVRSKAQTEEIALRDMRVKRENMDRELERRNQMRREEEDMMMAAQNAMEKAALDREMIERQLVALEAREFPAKHGGPAQIDEKLEIVEDEINALKDRLRRAQSELAEADASDAFVEAGLSRTIKEITLRLTKLQAEKHELASTYRRLSEHAAAPTVQPTLAKRWPPVEQKEASEEEMGTRSQELRQTGAQLETQLASLHHALKKVDARKNFLAARTQLSKNPPDMIRAPGPSGADEGELADLERQRDAISVEEAEVRKRIAELKNETTRLAGRMKNPLKYALEFGLANPSPATAPTPVAAAPSERVKLMQALQRRASGQAEVMLSPDALGPAAAAELVNKQHQVAAQLQDELAALKAVATARKSSAAAAAEVSLAETKLAQLADRLKQVELKSAEVAERTAREHQLHCERAAREEQRAEAIALQKKKTAALEAAAAAMAPQQSEQSSKAGAIKTFFRSLIAQKEPQPPVSGPPSAPAPGPASAPIAPPVIPQAPSMAADAPSKRNRKSGGKSVAWVSGFEVEPPATPANPKALKHAERAKAFRLKRMAELGENEKGERLAVPFLPLTRYESEMFVSTATELEDAECAICYHVAFDPPALGCGHLLCRSCVEGFVAQWGRKSCPTCTQSFANSKMESMRADKLEKLKVRCPLFKSGCEWNGLLGHQNEGLNQHTLQCGFVELFCQRCSGRVLRKDMDAHLEHVCAERLLPCSHCCGRVPAHRFVQHQEGGRPDGACEASVFCKNGCTNGNAGGVTIHPLDKYAEHLMNCSGRPTDCIVCAETHSVPLNRLVSHLFDVLPCSEEMAATLVQRSDEITKLRRMARSECNVSSMTQKSGVVEPMRVVDSGSSSPLPTFASSQVPYGCSQSIPSISMPRVLPLASLPLPASAKFAAVSPEKSSHSGSDEEDGWNVIRSSVGASVSVQSHAPASAPTLPRASIPPSVPPTEIQLIGHLPGIHEHVKFRYPRVLPLRAILTVSPFNSINAPAAKFHLISPDGDWDEVHPDCTASELGLEDGTKIGIKVN